MKGFFFLKRPLLSFFIVAVAAMVVATWMVNPKTGPWALVSIVLAGAVVFLWRTNRALSKAHVKKVEELQEKRIEEYRDVVDTNNAAMARLAGEVNVLVTALTAGRRRRG